MIYASNWEDKWAKLSFVKYNNILTAMKNHTNINALELKRSIFRVLEL